MMTLTKTLRYGKGYSGQKGNKCWIARITGSSKQYGLRREFIEADKVEREHFNRPRTMIDCSYELDDGLYEISEAGERWIILVWGGSDQQEPKLFRPTPDRIAAIVALLDEGMEFDAARRQTKPAKQVTNSNQ